MLAVCALLAGIEPAPVQALRDQLFDAYQRAMPRARNSAPAIIVAVDEKALDARGQWPWSRAVMADLIEAIAAAGPAAIGVDLLFVEADRFDPGADAALAAAVAASPTVLGVAGLEARDRRFAQPPKAAPVRVTGRRDLPLRRFDGHLQSRPEISDAASGRGLISVDTGDRIIRNVPLLAIVDGTLVPALSVELLRVALGEPLLRLEDDGGERVNLRVGEATIPLQADGTSSVYFGRHDSLRYVSAEDVLAGTADPALFHRKLVLIGVTGLGLLDLQATPLGERIPGIEVHQQVLEQAFDGVHLRRPTAASWLEAAFLVLAGLALLWRVPRSRVRSSSALLGGVLALLLAAGIGAFKMGLLLNVAAPLLGALVVFGAVLAATLAEADRQRRLLREAQARVDGELQAARRIQMGMLPALKVAFASERRFTLDAVLEPARTVGGDFYDCFMVDRHRLFFVVADVSGKGLPASLFMALSKALLKSLALRADDPDPGALLTRANVDIDRDNPESLFITAFAGLLDTRTGGLHFCNAGHEPPMVCPPGGAPQALEHSGGPPLCVLQGFEYPTGHHVMQPNEWLCVLTDGITEAMDRRGELYGAARLRAILAGLAGKAPSEVIAAVKDDVERFASGADASDDLTLLCVRWHGGSATERPLNEEDFEISER